jgi:hypothetical protein
LDYSPILDMEAVNPFEVSVKLYQTIRSHTPEFNTPLVVS